MTHAEGGINFDYCPGRLLTVKLTGLPLRGWKVTRVGLRCQVGAGHSESGVSELEAAPRSWRRIGFLRPSWVTTA